MGDALLEHRSDILSAAFRNLGGDAQAGLTRRYDALCAHHGMQPSRNNSGTAHGYPKAAIADALLLRAARDFPNLAA